MGSSSTVPVGDLTGAVDCLQADVTRAAASPGCCRSAG